MTRKIALASALTLCGLFATTSHAQSVYGEIGFSDMSTRLSVPLIGLSANAKPTMLRAVVGVSPFGGLSLEALAAGHLSDARLTGGSTSTLTGRAKVSEIFGVYIGSRLGLGPVELYGRAGWAQSDMSFQNLGSGSDSDFSYGGGLRLIPGKSLTFSADYMNYLNKGGARIEGYTFSLGYRF